MAATDRRGVDLVLNQLSGELLQASWQCVAEFGSFVELGRRDFLGHAKLAMEHFKSNRAFAGVDLTHLWIRKPRFVGDMLDRVLQLWTQGHVRPWIASTFAAGEISQPFRQMQKSQHIGKLVVTMPETEAASTLPTEPIHRTLKLRKDRSYLFAGGLGSLGVGISRWLVEKGAREIVFLSRAAGTLERGIKTAKMPVGGVLHAVMVLQHSTFVDMNWDDWLAALQPKITGTRNIHDALLKQQPDDPANYHAGNAFVESFAAYRRQLGLAASVLNVGFVSDAGYVADRPEAADSARATGQWFNTEVELCRTASSAW
ncbi:Highly reducing polyketide synthase gloL [Colletotrichum spinosum]|uniref:Highly reducing polyketide synthase gloL n=1 Tax=Colletotrichum spinosum TaxID=1347390 RepID=A0A4R8QLK7_9PEZI|nr:Highly reducing polyketide synthase gloL [Colletotrichum spinosum]